MARKPAPSNPSPAPKAVPVAQSDVRNTPIPRAGATALAAAAKTLQRQITPEMIAKRAYEIWRSGAGGSEFDNWVRAERELRG
jgi:hypothetical protein